MNQYTDIAEAREAFGGGSEIALVPTMGALHEGHAALIRRAAELAPRVVVSIFVNPLQFGPKEDFARYPRHLEHDERLAAEAGATDLFVPEARDFTPAEMQFAVDPGPMGEALEGAARPGHFRGVATIVLKLFNVVRPQVAVFGWKDAQQLLIIRRMVRDLNVPVQIEGVETVREADGLAMSSRNVYLCDEERTQASALSRGLRLAAEMFAEGETRAEELEGAARGMLNERAQLARVDYLQCVSMADLQPVEYARAGETMIAAAAYFGNTRLIDNFRF